LTKPLRLGGLNPGSVKHTDLSYADQAHLLLAK
jgi:hypothetical protein